MFSLRNDQFMNKKFTWRGLAIALCMGLFSPRYWWIGNLGERMFWIHCVNYVPDKVSILKAARHCVNVYCGYRWYDSELPNPKDAIYADGIL